MLPHLLIIFARYPRIGQVKTRMTQAKSSLKPLSLEEALALYGAFLADLLPRFQAVPDFDMLVMLGGASAREKETFRKHFFLKPAQVAAMPIEITDLGELMEHCFAAEAQKGYRRMALIGSDVPQLSVGKIRQAFEYLEKNDMVIGPDNGGGVYLVGYSRPLGLMKEGIVWGEETDRAAIIQRCLQRSVSYQLLSEEIDMDTSADLHEWTGRWEQFPQERERQKKESPHTFAYLRKLAIR